MLVPLILPHGLDVVVNNRAEVGVDSWIRAFGEVDGLLGCFVGKFITFDSNMAGNPAEYYADVIRDGVDGLKDVKGKGVVEVSRVDGCEC